MKIGLLGDGDDDLDVVVEGGGRDRENDEMRKCKVTGNEDNGKERSKTSKCTTDHVHRDDCKLVAVSQRNTFLDVRHHCSAECEPGGQQGTGTAGSAVVVLVILSKLMVGLAMFDGFDCLAMVLWWWLVDEWWWWPMFEVCEHKQSNTGSLALGHCDLLLLPLSSKHRNSL